MLKISQGKIIVLCLYIFMSGCSPEESYQGKPVSQWLALANDHDQNTRIRAIQALGSLGTPQAFAALTKLETGKIGHPI